MRKILLVTPEQSNLSGIVPAIEASGAEVSWAVSGDEALATVCKETVDLVLADEELGDMTGLAFVEKIVSVNAMINCALVSSLSDKAYHDASEGDLIHTEAGSPGAPQGIDLDIEASRPDDDSFIDVELNYSVP